MSPQEAFLAGAAAHAAFQLTVSVVVYPALADVAEDAWRPAHDAHSRRISYLVAVLYPGLLALGAWLAIDAPGSAATWVALGGTALAFAATALAAAPTHGLLGRGRTDGLIRRLLVADRVRTLGALIGLAGAIGLVA